jgi:hypothetical protein
LRLTRDPRHREIADAIRERVPVYSPSYEPAVSLLALVLLRLERAAAVLDDADERTQPAEAARLSQDARGWANSAHRLLESLGMTPTSRARLGLDLVRADDMLDRLAAAGREVRARADRQGEGMRT